MAAVGARALRLVAAASKKIKGVSFLFFTYSVTTIQSEFFGNIITEINELVAARKVNVDGTNINIKFFLGGDYKLFQ